MSLLARPCPAVPEEVTHEASDDDINERRQDKPQREHPLRNIISGKCPAVMLHNTYTDLVEECGEALQHNPVSANGDQHKHGSKTRLAGRTS